MSPNEIPSHEERMRKLDEEKAALWEKEKAMLLDGPMTLRALLALAGGPFFDEDSRTARDILSGVTNARRR